MTPTPSSSSSSKKEDDKVNVKIKTKTDGLSDPEDKDTNLMRIVQTLDTDVRSLRSVRLRFGTLSAGRVTGRILI